MQIDPADLGKRDAYGLLTTAIVPRPIAWISTLGADDTPNLAPFSFFMGVTAKPPTLAVAVGRRRGTIKDTASNIQRSGEFVVNVVTEELGEAMVLTSGDFAPEVNEFTEVGLTAVPAARVRPPRVGESPLAMECRLLQTLEIGPDRTALLIGEVVLFHVEESVWAGGDVDVARLRPLGRLGRSDYAPLGDLLEIARPALDPATGRLRKRPSGPSPGK